MTFLLSSWTQALTLLSYNFQLISFMMIKWCPTHWWHFASLSNSVGLGMGTVVNIAGMGTGTEL